MRTSDDFVLVEKEGVFWHCKIIVNVLLRLARRVRLLSCCLVELFKNIKQLYAVLLLLLLLQVNRVVLVETLLLLMCILELTLGVLPRLLGLEVLNVDLTRCALCLAHKLLFVPLRETVVVVNEVKSLFFVYHRLILTFICCVEGE